MLRHLPMELFGPLDLVYDKNAARKKIDDKSSALPTTPVTYKGKGGGVILMKSILKT